jgi:hypothetical protein
MIAPFLQSLGRTRLESHLSDRETFRARQLGKMK